MLVGEIGEVGDNDVGDPILASESDVGVGGSAEDGVGSDNVKGKGDPFLRWPGLTASTWS